MYIPRPAKHLFQIDDGWYRLLIKHGSTVTDRLRNSVFGRQQKQQATALHLSVWPRLLKIGSNPGCSSFGLPAPVSATGSGEWYDLYLQVQALHKATGAD